MRDPFSWSVPLGRINGVTVRLHVLFPMFILAVVLRIATHKDYEPYLWVEAIVLLAILFVTVLLHEFGHVIGARLVDGDGQEILLWPLGGLANVEVPHTWRANFVAAAAGPAVNLLLCLFSGLLLAVFSFWAPFSLFWDPFRPVLYHSGDSAYYGSKYGVGDAIGFKKASDWVSDAPDLTPIEGSTSFRTEKGDVVEPRRVPRADLVHRTPDLALVLRDSPNVRVKPYELTGWQSFLARLFFINWVLALMNIVLAGFPLDGGQMLQALLWPRYGYRQALLYAIFSGFVVSLLVVIWSAWVNDVFPLCLASFIFFNCWQRRWALEHGGEESMFGYDFSQGYTSLERDQPPPPRRRPGFFKRWLQARAARKIQRAQEQREAEERRMDELLEKVQRDGLQSLSDEERRFLKRVSDRFRNRN